MGRAALTHCRLALAHCPPPPHTHTHTITRAPSLPPDPHPLPQAEVDASLRRQGRGLLLELHQLNGVMRLLQD